jgi:hypothetical protein
VIAKTPSRTERGYFRDMLETSYMVSKDERVSDKALGFLAEVSREVTSH